MPGKLKIQRKSFNIWLILLLRPSRKSRRLQAAGLVVEFWILVWQIYLTKYELNLHFTNDLLFILQTVWVCFKFCSVFIFLISAVESVSLNDAWFSNEMFESSANIIYLSLSFQFVPQLTHPNFEYLYNLCLRLIDHILLRTARGSKWTLM